MIFRKGTILIVLLAVSILIGACKKEDTSGDEQKAADHKQIEQYVADNNLDGQFTDSGLYYVIQELGTGEHPNLSSIITVSYDLSTINDEPLQSGDDFTSRLSDLIEGWKEGIPYIGTGGKIKLIVPSHLGYPEKGVIIFDVTLHYFSK
jgi:FKBP-type peptidyl-prolyl cis-trans isomerase